MKERVALSKVPSASPAPHVVTSPTQQSPAQPWPVQRVARQLQRCAACGKLPGEGECEACRAKRLARRSHAQTDVMANPASNLGSNAVADPVSDPVSETLTTVPMTTPHDASEREAEQLAAQIATMPAPRVALQRAPGIQRLATSDFAPPVQQALQLSGAGRALPPTVRDYMEPRMNADFGPVRVHEGPQAAALTAGVQAEAFTYGHHIWLGAGQSTHNVPLMAHELTHVLQQTPQLRAAPSPDAPAASPIAAQPPIAQVATRGIQRKTDYYSLPPNPGLGSPGDRTHEIIQKLMGSESGNANLLYEVNVPGGSKANIGHNGRVDFFLAKPQARSIGVSFAQNATTPTYLPGYGKSRRGNADYTQADHQAQAAPVATSGAPKRARIRPPGFTADPGVVRMDDAPTEIKMGDIKPASGAESILGSHNQLGNYITGITQTASKLNAFNQNNPGSFHPATHPAWNPTVTRLDANEVAIPTILKREAYPGGKVFKVVGYDWRGNERKYTDELAHLYLFASTQKGIWCYEYVPITGPDLAKLHEGIKQQRLLRAQLQKDVIPPVNESPKQGARRPRAGMTPLRHPLRAQLRPAHPHAGQRRIQRQVTDRFDLNQWRTAHFLPWRERARSYLGSSEAREMEKLDVLRRIRERTGITRIQLPTEARELGSDLRQIHHWEEYGELFGRLRRIFGGLYVRVIQFYTRVRERFQRFTERRPPRTAAGSGVIGTIGRLVFSILKRFAGVIVQRVADRLMNAFHTGMTDYLNKVVMDNVGDEVAAVQASIEEVKTRVQEMETAVQAEYDRIVEELLAPYEEEIKLIDDVNHVIGDVGTLITTARVALCVASCGAPPGLGCLWGCVGQLVGEAVFNELVKSCWFQREFLYPAINSSSYVQALPDRIARVIHSHLVEAVPAGVRPLFGTIQAMPTMTLSVDDLVCDASQPAPDALVRSELEGLVARHGAARVAALMNLLVYRGAARLGGGLSPEVVAAIDRFFAQNPGATAEALSRLRNEMTARFPGSSTLDAELDEIGTRLRGGNAPRPSQERPAGPNLTGRLPSQPDGPRPAPPSGVKILEW